MAIAYHVFGPNVPTCNTGASNAFENIGVCSAGGSITIETLENEIKSDAGGMAPVEIQFMGAVAIIEFELASYDSAVLNKLIAAAMASGTAGTLGTPGALLGTLGYLKGLYIPSAADPPWYFPAAKLVSPSGNFGTEYTKRKLKFKAIPFVAGSGITSSGVALYTNSAPP